MAGLVQVVRSNQHTNIQITTYCMLVSDAFASVQGRAVFCVKGDFSQQQMKDLVLHLQWKKKDCEEMVIIAEAVTSRVCVRQKTAPWVFRRSAGPVCSYCIAEALEGGCGCYIEVVVSQKCMINFWRCFLTHPLRSRCQTKMLHVNFTSDSHWRLNVVCCILALWSSQTYMICSDFWLK